MGVRSSWCKTKGYYTEKTSKDDGVKATTTAENFDHMTEEEQLQNNTIALLKAKEKYQRLIDSQMELTEKYSMEQYARNNCGIFLFGDYSVSLFTYLELALFYVCIG